ncbi:LacI family DNA-binding transcriptional regulator [Paenibacillus hexagrammi]|uniref:LacI family DNA-binding transcriptional regulator n=1 Tax=Paenibacillus hexagrammi TaxID=2908839 RepID=A0ABY3SN84_9BACL|nr:LacI family DNA-binding transcriptional regulator [Paenibacillus sp. YPD9-1]UJF34948.1 LacI family DNA-binding transcriptional regulator [Paenibacillus sp. YPD9-1]
MARPKKVSMQDIAQYLGISKNAVSLALSNRKGVSEELRQQVLQAAEELGYDKHIGQDLTGKQEHSAVLILVPERIMSYEDNEHFLFYHDLIWGLEQKLRDQGFSAVIQRISLQMEQSLFLPELTHSINFDRVILFGIVREEYARLVQQKWSSLLMFDSFYRSVPGPAVTSANVEGAYTAAQYLLDQCHRRIGFIGPVHLTTSHEERWFGFWKALSEQSVMVDESCCLLESKGFHHTEEEIRHFLDTCGHLPTAFLCGNDRIALLLMTELQTRQIRVPEDISVIGFDGLDMSASSEPPLTTMKVDKNGMCEAAARWLQMETGRKEAPPNMRWYVPVSLIARSSVKTLV